MKRLIRVLCAALVAVMSTFGLAATSVSAAPTPATTGTTLAAGQQDPLRNPNQRLSVSITTFSPRVATPDSKEITVGGTVRNIGDREISDLDVRLQAGNAIRADSRMMAQLTTPSDPQSAASPFTRFSRRLAPGQTARFSVTVPLSSLGITRHGIYPLQLNVNGRPDYGGTARLLAVNLMLPVQPKPAAAHGGGPGVSMLWPLVGDHPRLLGTTDSGQALLADDGLARALRPGGRLYRLVDSAKVATAAHPKLGRALCFAIDPELLDAVNGMAHGYRVRNAGGGSRAGTGQQAATAWLAELRGVTKNRCVISLPYADADLVSLVRADAPDLARRALRQPVVADLLPHAHLLPNVLWPAGGTIDHRTLAAIGGKTPPTLLADPQALRGSGAAGPLPVSGTDGAHALRIDPLVSTALGGLPPHKAPSSTDAPAPGLLPATAVPGVRAQNGVAALVYRADSQSGEPALIAPPRRWQAGAAGLTSFLDTLAGLFANGSAHPAGLDQLASAPPGDQPVALDYSPQAAASEIPPGVTSKIVHSYHREEDLRSAMSRDSARTETPADVLNPVVHGLLGADSTAWRSASVPKRQEVVDAARSSLRSIIGQVTVHDPGRPISLASDASRIPVSVSNSLPVDVKVHISLEKAGGLKVQPIPNPVIPARSGRTLYVPTKVLRSGWLSIDVVLSTPGGMQLGSPARLRLRSSAYGTITLVVTGTAFALLVLLAGRRIYRRVRAARAGSDGHTGPEQENDSGEASPDEPSGVDVTRHDDREGTADAEPVTAPISWFGDEDPAAGHRPGMHGPSRDGQ